MRTRQRTHASASLVHVRFEFSVTLRSSGFDPGRWSGGVWGGFFHIRVVMMGFGVRIASLVS
jgi:hypothetical protein